MNSMYRQKRRKAKQVDAPQEKRPLKSLAFARCTGFLATSAAATRFVDWSLRDKLMVSITIVLVWLIVLWFLAAHTKRPRVEELGTYRFRNVLIGIANGLLACVVVYFVMGGFESPEPHPVRVAPGHNTPGDEVPSSQNLVVPVSATVTAPASAIASSVHGEIVGVTTDERHNLTTIQVHIERDGKFVPGLGVDNFSISSEGVLIEEFSLTERRTGPSKPLHALLLVDVSESAAKYRKKVEETVLRLMEAAPDSALFRPMVYATRSRFVCGWTNDREIVRRRMSEAKSGGKSSLRPSLLRSIRELRSRSPGMRVLIVFSDGHNNFGGSEIAPSDLISLCREAKVRVISVGIEHDSHNHKILRQLAQGTSGRHVTLDNGDLVVESLANIPSETGPLSYFITPNRPITGVTRIAIKSGANSVELFTNVSQWNHFKP